MKSKAQSEYQQIAKRSLAKNFSEFNQVVVGHLADNNILPEEAGEAEWLQAAKHVCFQCRRCAGTGNYITRIENGKPVGGDVCYRCDGKGYQNDADRRRNYAYDRWYRRVRVA